MKIINTTKSSKEDVFPRFRRSKEDGIVVFQALFDYGGSRLDNGETIVSRYVNNNCIYETIRGEVTIDTGN